MKFDRVVVLGGGEVCQKRLLPALVRLQAELGLKRIGVVDLRPVEDLRKGFAGLLDLPYVQFVQSTGSELPIDKLSAAGCLGEGSLAVVATPTAFHIPQALEIAPHVGRVAVEKPLSNLSREAASLMEWDAKIFPIGHQLFKQDVLCLIRASREGRIAWDQVARLNFQLFEKVGVGDRDLDDAIFDLSWHGFECLYAPLCAAGVGGMIHIEEAKTSTYYGGLDHPKRFTAARVRGWFEDDQRRLPFDLRVGKGLAENSKGIVGEVNRIPCPLASLSESGSAAHERLLRELLAKPEPDMLLDLRRVAMVVEACEQAVSMQMEMPGYLFGTTPDWLQTNCSVDSACLA